MTCGLPRLVGLLAGAAVSAASLAACAPPQAVPETTALRGGSGGGACDTRFVVSNDSSTAVSNLYFSHAGQRDWGADRLGARVLPPGASRVYGAARPGDHDFRVVWADRRAAELRRVDVCAVLLISVTDAGLRPTYAANPAAAAVRPPGVPAPPPPVGGGGTNAAPPRLSSGTGFVVARDRVLTNRHVVQGCGRVLVRTGDGRDLPASLPAVADTRRDLALLSVPGDPGPALSFRGAPVRRGEGVVTYGFPLAGLLSSGPTLTTGEVSALSGLGDDPAQFQISAPVQPGSSGGPLLDRQGRVVGVVVSKLNAQRVAQRFGDIPQNVNFAIKGEVALDFLRETAALHPAVAGGGGPGRAGADRSAAEVGEIAHRSTVFVRCER